MDPASPCATPLSPGTIAFGDDIARVYIKSLRKEETLRSNSSLSNQSQDDDFMGIKNDVASLSQEMDSCRQIATDVSSHRDAQNERISRIEAALQEMKTVPQNREQLVLKEEVADIKQRLAVLEGRLQETNETLERHKKGDHEFQLQYYASRDKDVILATRLVIDMINTLNFIAVVKNNLSVYQNYTDQVNQIEAKLLNAVERVERHEKQLGHLSSEDNLQETSMATQLPNKSEINSIHPLKSRDSSQTLKSSTEPTSKRSSKGAHRKILERRPKEQEDVAGHISRHFHRFEKSEARKSRARGPSPTTAKSDWRRIWNFIKTVGNPHIVLHVQEMLLQDYPSLVLPESSASRRQDGAKIVRISRDLTWAQLEKTLKHMRVRHLPSHPRGQVVRQAENENPS